MSAYGQASIVINRCKRILALVDDYAEKMTADTRTILRKALMEEFEAPAIVPPVAAGSVDGSNLAKVIETLRRERDESEAKLRERAEKAEKQWDSWMACANHWQGRAEKAEARVKVLEEEVRLFNENPANWI